jgi:hypothetical protein
MTSFQVALFFSFRQRIRHRAILRRVASARQPYLQRAPGDNQPDENNCAKDARFDTRLAQGLPLSAQA